MNRTAAIVLVVATGAIVSFAGLTAQAGSSARTAKPKYRASRLTLPSRMRGVSVPAYAIDVALIKRLAKWGCNTVRIGISVDHNNNVKQQIKPTANNPLLPYRQNLKHLDAILPISRKLHMRLIINAADIYGRHLDVFWHKVDGMRYRHELPRFWKAFAERYKNASAIVAYDVLNEPNYKRGDAALWTKQMLPESVAAIRSVNPDIWLVVEPGPWGLPKGFAHLKPIEDSHVIYSFHFYAPHYYTHQGVGKQRAKTRGKLRYPGMLRMFPHTPKRYWDKQALRRNMEPAIRFAHKYHVRMLVGEFGVTRWAPGGAHWLGDDISIFESEGFGWLFHSPVGWNGWNPTFSADAPEAALLGKDSDGGKMTDKLKVLLRGWKLNARPVSP